MVRPHQSWPNCNYSCNTSVQHRPARNNIHTTVPSPTITFACCPTSSSLTIRYPPLSISIFCVSVHPSSACIRRGHRRCHRRRSESYRPFSPSSNHLQLQVRRVWPYATCKCHSATAFPTTSSHPSISCPRLPSERFPAIANGRLAFVVAELWKVEKNGEGG